MLSSFTKFCLVLSILKGTRTFLDLTGYSNFPVLLIRGPKFLACQKIPVVWLLYTSFSPSVNSKVTESGSAGHKATTRLKQADTYL